MNHPEKKIAKSIDMPGRCRKFTDTVYGGVGDSKAMWAEMKAAEASFLPPEPEYHLYFGEMHGHTNFSDGAPDIDTYFRHLRDEAKVDFAAVTDHDHGGVGKPELWVGKPSKWDRIQQKVAEYDQPGTFTTILGYERDSYPYYNNMVLYFGSHTAEMVRGVRDGEITAAELRALLARNDVLVAPHDTYSLSSGADLGTIPLDLMTPLIEVISRGDAAEYMGNPANAWPAQCSGGYWQDALRRGAHMGCIGGSDDHACQNATVIDAPYPQKFPGMTGVWAKENTLAGIFEALCAKRCYGYMGGRIAVDFRINGHYMGETLTLAPEEDCSIFFSVSAECPVKTATVVKNCRDYAIFHYASEFFFDYRREQEEDCYYLRAELEDGRFAWSSPIWVRQG